MENKPSFDLNRALRAHMQGLSQSGNLDADDLEELEHHLRDSIAKLQSTGLCLEEAFFRATRNLGGSEIVADEFLKVNPARVWSSRILCLVAGAFLFFAVPKLCDTAAGLVMRGLWRLPLNAHLLGLLALTFKWLPILGAILAVGWWMRARGDSWTRAAAACFRKPLLTTFYLILIPIVLSFCFKLVGAFVPPLTDGTESFLQGQREMARMQIVELWSPWTSFLPSGLELGPWSKVAFYFPPALLIILAVVKWRGAISQPATACIWGPRALWLLMGAITKYSVSNLGYAWYPGKGMGVIYPFHVPLLMNDGFAINGNLAGLMVLLFWWGPLAASMVALTWLAVAKAETLVRVVEQLFRRPIFLALGLMIFPVISTLFFRPVFADLAVSGRGDRAPQRLLTVFSWCHYGSIIVPSCLLLGLLAYMVRRHLNRVARLA